jgi:hypothetical protein
MWPTSIAHDPSASREMYETDRRSACRYPIILPLRYTLIRGEHAAELGRGTTLNISSRGVLFEAQDRLPDQSEIELAVRWPVLLQGSCALQLIIRGRVVRIRNNAIAILTKFREFRTAGSENTANMRLMAPSIRSGVHRRPHVP